MRSAFGRLGEHKLFFGSRARILYEVIGWVFRNETDVRFMNYGYSDTRIDRELPLSEADEAERYCAQLYHAVASQVPLAGKRVLDVGSGRGGGAAHVQRHFGPKATIGCDFAGQVIAFCRRVHSGVQGLGFIQGDAAALPLPDASFDVVTNIESSHCYPDRPAFFAEVARVLRPGGAFLYADFTQPRCDPALARAAILAEISIAGLAVLDVADITGQILAGLDADDARKLREIRRRFPFGTRWFARLWSGTRGSWIYRDFAEGRRAYLMIHARVPMPARPSRGRAGDGARAPCVEAKTAVG